RVPTGVAPSSRSSTSASEPPRIRRSRDVEPRYPPESAPSDRWSGVGTLRTGQHGEVRECGLRGHAAGFEILRSEPHVAPRPGAEAWGHGQVRAGGLTRARVDLGDLEHLEHRVAGLTVVICGRSETPIVAGPARQGLAAQQVDGDG